MASPSASPSARNGVPPARIWRPFTFTDLEADSDKRFGDWDHRRHISFGTTTPRSVRSATDSQFINRSASERYTRMTMTHPRVMPDRHSFPRTIPTPANVVFPDWLLWEDADRFFSQRTEAFEGPPHDRRWQGLSYRAAIDLLTDYYNLQGRLLRREWIMRDELAAALKIMVRDLSPVRNVTVVPIAWQGSADPGWVPSLLPPHQDVLHQIKTWSDLVLFPLYADGPGHFTGMIVDQRDGMVYWYDPMWTSGRSEALFVNDIKALKEFYARAGAPLHIEKLIDASACVIDAVQQPGGWECGLYVLEWFRTAVRYGQLCPTRNPTWRDPRLQGSFCDRLRANWIRWISYEFRYDGNRDHNAMRDVPQRSYDEARAGRSQPVLPTSEGDNDVDMIVPKTPIKGGPMSPMKIDTPIGQKTPIAPRNPRLGTPTIVPPQNPKTPSRPQATPGRGTGQLVTSSDPLSPLPKQIDTPRVKNITRSVTKLGMRERELTPIVRGTSNTPEGREKSVSIVESPNEDTPKEDSPNEGSGSPESGEIWSEWTERRKELTPEELRDWERNEAQRKATAGRHLNILNRRNRTKGKLSITECTMKEWVDQYDDPIAEAAYQTPAYAPWVPPSVDMGWDGWARHDAREAWKTANGIAGTDDEGADW